MSFSLGQGSVSGKGPKRVSRKRPRLHGSPISFAIPACNSPLPIQIINRSSNNLDSNLSFCFGENVAGSLELLSNQLGMGLIQAETSHLGEDFVESSTENTIPDARAPWLLDVQSGSLEQLMGLLSNVKFSYRKS